jgi:hypothetical protein
VMMDRRSMDWHAASSLTPSLLTTTSIDTYTRRAVMHTQSMSTR